MFRSSVLQTYAFIASENPSYLPLISILSSVLSIAYSSTTVTYDRDVDPDCRASIPSIYGAIPSTARSTIFLSMFAFSACTVLLKVFCTALLGYLGGLYVCVYVLEDMLFFVLFKIARDDFRYWLNVPNTVSLITSALIRPIMKVLTDYTGLVHARKSNHPNPHTAPSPPSPC